jgi:NTE family protein
MNRRQFITAAAAALLAAGCAPRPGKRIGLALGSGGARGLAHILMLAVIGSLYASGMHGSEIQQLIDRLTVSKHESWLESLFDEDITRWLDFIELRLGKGGLIESDALMKFLEGLMKVNRFSQLQIPMRIVATDLWKREQVIMSRGDLISAIKASMAIPGLFSPVERNGHVLVDGGLVNPVPYDLLLEECDVVVAVDALGTDKPKTGTTPGYFDTSFHTFQVMQTIILKEKLKQHKPDIYIKPDIEGVRVLEFYKVDEIFAQSEPAMRKLYRKLRRYKA